MGEVRAVYLPVLSELVRTVLISGAPSMVVFECQIRRAADEQVGSARKSRRFGPGVERSVFRATKVCVEQAGGRRSASGLSDQGLGSRGDQSAADFPGVKVAPSTLCLVRSPPLWIGRKPTRTWKIWGNVEGKKSGR